MARFNMKDYESVMEEEERQDRLQKELESKLHEEDMEANLNWREWQEKQRIKKRKEESQYEDPFDLFDTFYPEDFLDGWPELDDDDEELHSEDFLDGLPELDDK